MINVGGKKASVNVSSGIDTQWQSADGPEKPSRNGALVFTFAMFIAGFALTALLWWAVQGALGVGAFFAAACIGWVASSSIHIAMEWERVAVMRLGSFNHIAGPGIFFTIPVIEQIALRVDQRTIATPFGAEKTLTSDLVPVDVDAVLLWMVWDAKKACLEVEDYSRAVSYVAQTAMREAIGRASIARVALQRNQIDQELEEIISEEVEPWGVAIIAVKVRDIVIPDALQEAMSLEAQAERERNARIVLADVERELSGAFLEASENYDKSDTALKLRTMHLLYETVKKSGGSVVTVPSAISDGFVNDSAELLTDALKR